MTISLVGMNHQTAPVELREKLTLSGQSLQRALEALGAIADVQEGGILSTCNRFEVAAVFQQEAGHQQLAVFIATLLGMSVEDISPYLYEMTDMDVARHLMRVAAGVDSMILGETQILGQVIQAYNNAQAVGLAGPIMSQLFSRAIHAGKRARSETEISRFTTSVSHAAALMLLEKTALAAPHVLVVGAGKMAVVAAKALQVHGISNISFVNRSYERATSLAAELGGTSLSWQQLGQALSEVDAVITATGAPHIVISRSDVETVLPNRRDRPLLFVDIAVPRDIEVSVGGLPGVRRFDIDDLQSIVDSNTAQREAAIPAVEAIIEQEHATFREWYQSRAVTPVIRDLRRWANEVAQVEVAQALNKMPDDDPQIAHIVNRMAHRIVNKLLHEPTIRLRGQALEGNGYSYAHTLSELFGLDTSHSDLRRAAGEDGDKGVTDIARNLHCITPNGSERHPHEL